MFPRGSHVGCHVPQLMLFSPPWSVENQREHAAPSLPARQWSASANPQGRGAKRPAAAWRKCWSIWDGPPLEISSGWWLSPTPLKNDGVRQWEGWHPITCSKPPVMVLFFSSPKIEVYEVGFVMVCRSPHSWIWSWARAKCPKAGGWRKSGQHLDCWPRRHTQMYIYIYNINIYI